MELSRIVVLVPAYREEAQIAATIESLLTQDIELHRIVVIPNTSGSHIEDDTAKIARRYEDRGVIVDEFTGNQYRKSGAMNYSWKRWTHDADYVFTMDADTILFPDTIRGMLEEFRGHRRVGAVCARYWAKAGKGMAWELQRIEYARYDDQRDLRKWKVTVASGAAVLYRRAALEEVLAYQDRTEPWDSHSLIEDYALTLDLRELEWEVKAAKNSHVLTDTPQGFKDLWDQRQRWGRGGFDEVRKKGLRKFLLYDIIGYGMFALNVLMRILFVAYFLMLVTNTGTYEISLLGMIPLAIVWLSRMTSYLRLNGKSPKDALIVGVVFIEDCYGFFLEVCATLAIIRSLKSTHQNW